MAVLTALVLISCPLLALSVLSPLCPVSSSLYLNNNVYYHGYPMDFAVFTNTSKTRNSLGTVRDDDVIPSRSVYNCTGYESQPGQIHSCSTEVPCVLTEENVKAAMRASKSWNVSTSFCKLHEELIRSTETVNVIVLGGSVTIGSWAMGCCCDRDVDSRCPSDMPAACKADVTTVCTWSAMFVNWLQKYAKARVRYINIARSGTTSLLMAESMTGFLKNFGITNFTSSDLVFIDHSINDATTFCRSTKSSHVEGLHSLESLAQTILSLSVPGSWPTVVLLEVWPFPGLQDPSKARFDYNENYRAIASTYHWTLWSYRFEFQTFLHTLSSLLYTNVFLNLILSSSSSSSTIFFLSFFSLFY